MLNRGQNGTRKWVVEGLVIMCGAFMDALMWGWNLCDEAASTEGVITFPR